MRMKCSRPAARPSAERRARIVVYFVAATSALALAVGAGAQKQKEAWEYFKEPAFLSAYAKALGSKGRASWLAKRRGPAPEDRFVLVAGERYAMSAFCKAHDCEANSAVILYSPEKKAVFGTVFEQGMSALIGNPSPAVASELDRLWHAEWRSPAR